MRVSDKMAKKKKATPKIPCSQCGKLCKGKHGLKKHIGMAHKGLPTPYDLKKQKEETLEKEFDGEEFEIRKPMTSKSKPIEPEKDIEAFGEDGYRIMSPKQMSLSGQEAHMAEILINAGFAKDFRELTRKNMRLSFSLLNLGGMRPMVDNPKLKEAEKEEESGPIKIIKQLQRAEQDQAIVDTWKTRSTKVPNEDEMDKAVRDFTKLAKFKQLQKAMSGDDFNIKDLMQMQMLDRMMAKGGGNDNSQVSALQQQINNMQSQMAQKESQHRQELAMQGLKDTIAKIGDKKGMDAQELMKIWADRDKAVKSKDTDLQKARDEILKVQLDSKIAELSRVVAGARSSGGSLGNLKKFSDELNTVKEIAKSLGASGEKDTGDKAMDFVKDTLDAVKGPLLTPVGQALAERVARGPIAPPQMPPNMPPPQLPPGQNPMPGQMPKPKTKTVLLPGDITPTEVPDQE